VSFTPADPAPAAHPISPIKGTTMKTTRTAAAALGTAALAASALLFTAPNAFAAPQANQEFFTGNGNWYLGGPAESALGLQIGHIWTPQAPGKCLNMDVSGQVMDGHNQTIILWDCNSDLNEQWDQIDNGDGSWTYYTYPAQGWYPAAQYMDSHYGGPRTLVNADNWDGSGDQRWTIGPASQLQSVGSPGQCLDDSTWGTANGNPMQLYYCAY
jgi:hypothetical protein